MLIYMANNCSPSGRLDVGVIPYLVETYGYTPSGIKWMWNRHKQMAMDKNKAFQVVRKKGSGRKRKVSIEHLKQLVRNVPFHQRSKVRSLSKAINIPRSTLHRALQLGVLQRTTSTVKPILTENNKLSRIAWVKSKVAEDGRFVDMMNEIHIDEKWFYITREKERYIIVEGESIPERKVKSKRFIAKVMFLAAFARPRFDPTTGGMWDGKVGIWPFVTVEIAQRNSVNRPAGTPVTKCVNVDRVVSRKMYKEKLTPAILEKKHHFSSDIYVQQDNAKPHPTPDDKEMNEHYDNVQNDTGVNIRLDNQSANSPDLNTLDLAFFRAIQSLQQEVVCNNIDELIARVEQAYWDLPLETCEKVWVTLQMVMNEIIINGGNNGYKLPHMGKDKIMREMGKIPDRLPCPALVTPNQSLNGTFVKAWMQHIQAAEAVAALQALPLVPPLEDANPVDETVVPPQLPPIDVDVDDASVDEVVLDESSPTGVAEVEAQFQATAVRLDVDERNDDSMLTIDEEEDEEDSNDVEDEEVVVEKGVYDASRITLLMKTFWLNMGMDSWNNEHGEYDHDAIEGAAELSLPEEEEEQPVMDGRLSDKNHHRQNQNLVAERVGRGFLV